MYRDIIISHKCTINDNDMMNGSWHMDCNRVFCDFGPFFISLTTLKIKILKNWKKMLGDIIILHKFTKNHDHMLYCSWDRHMSDVIFIFHFGLFFALLPLNSLKNQNFKKEKKEKNTWRYPDFIHGYQKLI